MKDVIFKTTKSNINESSGLNIVSDSETEEFIVALFLAFEILKFGVQDLVMHYELGGE